MHTIVETYNNIPFDPALTPAKGFSCFIEEAALLFDTGGDAAVLAGNLRALGIDPAEIRTLVLSHDHWDHVGGLAAVLGKNPDLEVLIPAGFSEKLLAAIEEQAETTAIGEWQEIENGIASTGPCGGSVPEQSLVLSTSGGSLIVAGCAHPHISRIIETVKKHGPVFGAIGGFHTISEADRAALKDLAYLAPSHCTEKLEVIVEENTGSIHVGGTGTRHILP
ncbi:MAG: 7,8-dihydropterin-6-yl-methyl-4-(beta-D-ribofuranosyl)aminobenzene 5-phosphate synthase [Methanofollis sp.]|nr:7,8-dihydropterin-6-yl-methyl-4-(beta-D-ribofuranosyl)aminobenzene 5-phosphate synthase [Methanofollis sp.]